MGVGSYITGYALLCVALTPQRVLTLSQRPVHAMGLARDAGESVQLRCVQLPGRGKPLTLSQALG